jgi:chromate transporter
MKTSTTAGQHSLQFYWQLFLFTFYLSAFTFGGGYVIVPLMRKKSVEQHKWLEDSEMINLVAIAQSAPGPIAVNASLLIGFRMAGIAGAFVTLLGTILPPLIILSVISFFYKAFKENQLVNLALKGMGAGIAAVIVDAVIKMGKEIVKTKQFIVIALMFLSFLAKILFGQVVLILVICGAIGLVLAAIRQYRSSEGHPI